MATPPNKINSGAPREVTEYKVKTALDPLVERQQLNRIIASLDARLSAIDGGTSPSTDDDDNREEPDTGGGDTGTAVIGAAFDGSGAPIEVDARCDIYIPFDCTIDSVTMLADQVGAITVDIWSDTYGNYPPTNADSITAAATPNIAAANKSQDSTLTGWNTTITAGTTLRFNVEACSLIERLALILTVTKG